MSAYVCHKKKAYENEWEAEIARIHMEDGFNLPFMYYPCGSHYHIANADPKWRTLRRQIKGIGDTFCAHCQKEIPLSKFGKSLYKEHAQTRKHRARVRGSKT